MCIFLKDATLEFPWAVHHYLVLINKCEAGHIYEKVFSKVSQSRKQVRHTEIIWRKNFSAVLFEKAGGSHLSEHRIGLFLWSSTGLRCPTLSFNALLHSPSMPFNVLHSPSFSFIVIHRAPVGRSGEGECCFTGNGNWAGASPNFWKQHFKKKEWPKKLAPSLAKEHRVSSFSRIVRTVHCHSLTVISLSQISWFELLNMSRIVISVTKSLYNSQSFFKTGFRRKVVLHLCVCVLVFVVDVEIKKSFFEARNKIVSAGRLSLPIFRPRSRKTAQFLKLSDHVTINFIFHLKSCQFQKPKTHPFQDGGFEILSQEYQSIWH